MIEQFHLKFQTKGRGAFAISDEVKTCISSQYQLGISHIFLQHTSASLILSENSDPDVLKDLETFLSSWIKDGDRRFLHNYEGMDDMPAHIRTIMTQNHLSIPIHDGKLLLGTWQGIYLYEHRTDAHLRHLVVTNVYF